MAHTGAGRPRVVVVGAGISGLSAAHRLLRAPRPPEVVVLEASARPGGKVLTQSFAGRPVETGPDGVLARVPDAAALCREVGLGEDLVGSTGARALMWTRGRLRPLPPGLVFGLPSRPAALVQAGILSPRGAARASLDLVLPAAPVEGDVSIGELLEARFGAEVVDRLADPLLGGIHAGDARRLSAAATLPQLHAAARRGGSLLRALRGTMPPPSSGPTFLTLRCGFTTLVERLAAAVGDGLRLGVEVRGLVRAGAGWRVETDAGAVEADAVVLTVPAFAAAAVLTPILPEAARLLAAVDHASVGIVTFALPPAALGRRLDGSGFLVPRVEGRLMTACTWLSSKWPHLAGDGAVLVRCSVGRIGDERWRDLDDATLVARLQEELGRAVGLRGEPEATSVTRWERALPQYDVGHLDRVARVEAALPSGLYVGGAAYRGVGIPACIAQGGRAAEAALRWTGGGEAAAAG